MTNHHTYTVFILIAFIFTCASCQSMEEDCTDRTICGRCDRGIKNSTDDTYKCTVCHKSKLNDMIIKVEDLDGGKKNYGDIACKRGPPPFVVVLIIIAVILVVGGIAFGIYCCIKKRRAKSQAPQGSHSVPYQDQSSQGKTAGQQDRIDPFHKSPMMMEIGEDKKLRVDMKQGKDEYL